MFIKSYALVSGLLIFQHLVNAASPPVVQNVGNSASNGSSAIVLSPGCLFSIYGYNLGNTTTSAVTAPLPTSLGDIAVTIGGIPAPLIYVSGFQINAQVPYAVAPGNAVPIVVTNSAGSAQTTAAIGTESPNMFYIQNGVAAADAQGRPININSPAMPGQTIVVYFTGQGPLDNAIPTGSLAPNSPLSRLTEPVVFQFGNNEFVTPVFVGMTPGQVGLAQANVQVPADLKNYCSTSCALLMKVGPTVSEVRTLYVPN